MTKNVTTLLVLNPKQRRFVRIYLGRDDRYAGNATACHKVVYGSTNLKVAQTSGSRLLNHPTIKREIELFAAAQAKQTITDANFVLEQSVRLYDRAMGDAPIEVDVIETDPDTGLKRARTMEKREYNPAIARQALELIGRHTSVQAFQDNVEHTHTHRLEQALARRSKIVEARATHALIEGSAQRIGDDDDQGPAGEVQRGCIEAEVNEQTTHDPAETRSASGRAQDD